MKYWCRLSIASLTIVATVSSLQMIGTYGKDSSVLAQESEPSASAAAVQEPSSSQSARTGAFGGRGGGMFQSLSPDQRRALIERFRQRRAARGQGNAANLGSSGGAQGNGAGLGASSAAQSVPPNFNEVSIKYDVPYGKDPLQQLDIYAPKAAPKSPLPVVVFAHGGGWRRGDKNQGDRKSKGCAYVAEGILFSSINYRLAPNVMHPKQVQDVAAAVAWVKKHASEFGGDGGRIYLMGHSAGAQLVDLLATNDKYLNEVGLQLKDIKGVISLDTASLNLTERRNDDGPETKIVGPMLDNAFGKDPAVLKDGSPTLNICAGKNYPPFLMFCGSKRLNCVHQHKEFADAMKKVGGDVTVRPVPLNHGDINRASGEPGSEIYKGCMQMIKGS